LPNSRLGLPETCRSALCYVRRFSMKMILEKIKTWYQGKESELIAVEREKHVDIYARYEKSTSARIVFGIVNFWRRHWQWTIMFIVTVIGCVFAFPTFYQFIKQTPVTETRSPQNNNSNKSLENNQPIHNQAPLKRAEKSNLAGSRTVQVTKPASDITKQQRIENWRKEIQSFIKDGIFDREKFLVSKTYYEISPYLSETMKKDLTRDLTSPMYAAEQYSKKTVSHRIILNFPSELDRIANEYH
jgi:hypothetical protein